MGTRISGFEHPNAWYTHENETQPPLALGRFMLKPGQEPSAQPPERLQD